MANRPNSPSLLIIITGVRVSESLQLVLKKDSIFKLVEFLGEIQQLNKSIFAKFDLFNIFFFQRFHINIFKFNCSAAISEDSLELDIIVILVLAVVEIVFGLEFFFWWEAEVWTDCET
jgi:hypothetical protein